MLLMKTKLSLFALAALLFGGLPIASSSAAIGIAVGIAPPPIPIYAQPYCPGPGYIWTPGYWAYSDFGYYWVPGVWVLAPRIGFLWTPGYWGYSGNRYVFYDGYWGPSVGYYGGINYGFGYVGHGYYGGRWAGNTFRYNTAVTRVNTTVINNTYVDNSFASKATKTRASFNGPGGVQAKPTKQEEAVPKANRLAPTKTQRSIVEAAKENPALHAKNNKGKPKADAVNAVRTKVAPDASAQNGRAGRNQKKGENQAAADNQAGADNQPRGNKQGRAEDRANNNNVKQADAAKPDRAPKRAQKSDANANASRNVDRARPVQAASKPARERNVARPTTRAGSNNQLNNAPNRNVQRKPQAVQRQRAPMARKAPQAAPQDRGPAQGQQKKKKRKNAPDDQ
ncbi:MAG: YXWGXW repeat-containing protein [Chthoniobacterales bacterium]|nr:YXWGXW repeat-containing protein [Chthoniobacterales bacterium]